MKKIDGYVLERGLDDDVKPIRQASIESDEADADEPDEEPAPEESGDDVEAEPENVEAYKLDSFPTLEAEVEESESDEAEESSDAEDEEADEEGDVAESLSGAKFSSGDWVRWDTRNSTELGKVTGLYHKGDDIPDFRGSRGLSPDEGEHLYSLRMYKQRDGSWHPISGGPIGHYEKSLRSASKPENVSGSYIELSRETSPDLEIASLSRYDVGDFVEADDGRMGLVTDVLENEFRWDLDGVDADEKGEEDEVDPSGSPYYIVLGSEPGAGAYRASQLKKVNEEDVLGEVADVDTDDMMSEMDDADLRAWTQGGFDDIRDYVEEEMNTATGPTLGFKRWPPSWTDSPKPARLIALDAWTSMGATHRGCTRELRGKVVSPNRLCAAFKDEMYGTTYWRTFND